MFDKPLTYTYELILKLVDSNNHIRIIRYIATNKIVLKLLKTCCIKASSVLIGFKNASYEYSMIRHNYVPMLRLGSLFSRLCTSVTLNLNTSNISLAPHQVGHNKNIFSNTSKFAIRKG